MPHPSQFSTPSPYRFLVAPKPNTDSDTNPQPRSSGLQFQQAQPQRASKRFLKTLRPGSSSGVDNASATESVERPERSQFAPTPRFTIPPSSISASTSNPRSQFFSDAYHGDELDIQDSSPLAAQQLDALDSRFEHTRNRSHAKSATKIGDCIDDDEDEFVINNITSNSADQATVLNSVETDIPSLNTNAHTPPPPANAKPKRKRLRMMYYSTSDSEPTPSPEPQPSPPHIPKFIFPGRPTRRLSHSSTGGLPTDIASHKPSFILPPVPHLSEPGPDSAPHGTSSRKSRGPKYISEGLADTVRTWVLDLAGQQATTVTTNTRLGGERVSADRDTMFGTRVKVKETKRGCGMYLVRDENGALWMLTGEPSLSYSAVSDRTDDHHRVVGGTVVGIKRGSVTWSVDLPSQDLSEEGVDDAGTTGFLRGGISNDEVGITRPNQEGLELETWTVVLEWSVLSR